MCVYACTAKGVIVHVHIHLYLDGKLIETLLCTCTMYTVCQYSLAHTHTHTHNTHTHTTHTHTDTHTHTGSHICLSKPSQTLCTAMVSPSPTKNFVQPSLTFCLFRDPLLPLNVVSIFPAIRQRADSSRRQEESRVH